MATALYRLARFSFRRRRLVTAVWAAVLIVLGLGALTLSGQLTNSVTIPGTESQRAIDHLKERFPQASVGGATARVAIEAPAGQKLTDPVNQPTVEQLVNALKTAPKARTVSDPFQTKMVSPDGRVALVQISYGVQASELTESDREAVQAPAEPARHAGLTVEFGGDAIEGMPETGATEGLGVVVAAIVLTVTFGSLLAAGLPLLTALLGVGVGMAGLFTVSGFTELNSNTPILALMLGLAVGIDYALFIVSRYRHELGQGHDPEQAAARSVGTAGSAVVFAGLTVIIALVGLTVVGIPFLGQMGVAAAATVAVAVLIALTLLPAILGFAGRKVLGRRREQTRTTNGERWARFVARHRVPVLVIAVLGLLVVAIPALSMQLGLPNDATAAPDSTQRKAYDIVSSGFGPGVNGPLIVVVSDATPQNTTEAADRISRLGDVAAVTQPQFNAQHDTAMFTVIPKSGPSSEQTEKLVGDIRNQAGHTELAVTGQTALQIDVSEKLAGAMLPYLALIVGLAFLLLMLVFRSLVVPLKATLGFLGSVVATFGAVVAVFQWGWLDDLLGVKSTAPIMSMLPILLIGVLFGLAMDYQVFLVTRMREEYVHGTEAQEATITGFRHGSRVVVAAALIMISVFAGFVLADTTLIQSIGFALAFGVLVDAFVVRMTLVPAVMSLLGAKAWWLPRWLDRVLPNVDVEGESLTKQLDEREPANVG
ncbi:RND superfamily putative drug exporter [Amycolatopsis bartoniae]|uniref:Membrane protein n=1 Tax=Amycolatopsis bartoniae TaxID=941986 RepID=A0A8H9J471_9PSEU|nr:MMPL family transporter [Amycolatopsis bartoniae]MBB2934034.1 RND superfamily putative drug exporter [Amycolatopsis bartoniae]TVT07329.1 MMPL family transporter [Amycolatopsis bartoniae]GHF84813.1 membrane protein [Amycolatopsis bartoniae]